MQTSALCAVQREPAAAVPCEQWQVFATHLVLSLLASKVPFQHVPAYGSGTGGVQRSATVAYRTP